MAEIKTIHGGRVPGTPSDAVIEELEGLLARARSGELVGVAWAGVLEGNSYTNGWVAESGTRNALGMSIDVLQHRFVVATLNGNDGIEA